MAVKELISKLFTEPTSKIYIQIFRYLFSGGVAFVSDFGLLYLSYNIFQINSFISVAIGFSAGLIITYLLNVYWVFDKRRLKKQRDEFSIFVLIGIIGLLITEFFMWFFADVAGISNLLLSKILTTVVATGWSFSMKKIILFSKKEK